MKVWAPFLLAGAAACGSADPPPAPPDEPEPQVQTVASACELRRFEDTLFTVCPFDAAKDRLELVDGRAFRSLANLEVSLGPRAQQVRFAMNAGMYDEEGAPIGLFVAEGEEKKRINLRAGGGNFHLLPNGVFAVDSDGKLSITPSKEFDKEVRSPRWATQSGPMLVIDGKLHPKFDENGKSQLIRNGVGVKDARTAFFAISEEPVSFGRFARFFRDELGAPNALYLDGSVSSLWGPATGRQDGYSGLGPMVVAFRPRVLVPLAFAISVSRKSTSRSCGSQPSTCSGLATKLDRPLMS